MKSLRSTRTVIVATVLLGGLPAGSVLGQNYGTWIENGTTITASGDDKTFDGKCNGKNVNLMGDAQRVTLHGACGLVVANGDHKSIVLETARELRLTGDNNKVVIGTAQQVRLVGDNNAVTYATKPGSINTMGDGNSFRAR